MPYNFFTDLFMQRNSIADFLSSTEVQFYIENGCFVILSPLGA